MSSQIDHEIQDLIDERKEIRNMIQKLHQEISALEVDAGKLSVIINRKMRRKIKESRKQREKLSYINVAL